MPNETNDAGMAKEYLKEYRIYRAKKDNKGSACSWQLSHKDNRYNPWMLFLTFAPQTGVDHDGNAAFDWKGESITVKLGENDIGEMIAVLSGYQTSLNPDYKGTLYHQTPGGGNKVIGLSNVDGKLVLKVSAQDADKKPSGPYAVYLSGGEAMVLLTLLRQAIIKMFGW